MAGSGKFGSSLSNLKSFLQLQLEKFVPSLVKAVSKPVAPKTPMAPADKKLLPTSGPADKPMIASSGHIDIPMVIGSDHVETSSWIKVHSRSLGMNNDGVGVHVDTPTWKEVDSRYLGITNNGKADHVDSSNWRKVHSRSLGITLSSIPDSSKIVLKILQSEGYDAYLVGGCVRDLLLNKVPKDFDVITSANLAEIKKQFHRAYFVGRKFPICMVHVRGSAFEVSSFETVAKHATEKANIHLTEIPKGYDAKDFLRWRNSLDRDFTINSLFYDPFAQRVYDYSNGLRDLRAMKLQTLVPAHLSFEEDCARILRGIRIAARLNLSFAKDTEKAIHSLYASITTLDKGRLMMELNYMLSYGAANPSLILLKRFNILELLLPFHAAYLAERYGTQTPLMLMKLFFNLDRVTSCGQPCHSGLWVSLLAFHLALVNNPQDAIVVWTFSSLLYHGNWEDGVKAARELSAGYVHFTPEILNSLDDVTDEELLERVAKFASMLLESINILIDSECLSVAMNRFPSSPSSDLIWISKNTGKDVSTIFNVLVNEAEPSRKERICYNIDYYLLGKGDILETRFALGKVIMDTMRSGVINGQTKCATEEDGIRSRRPIVETVRVQNQASPISTIETPKGKDGAKRGHKELDGQMHQQKAKKQKPDDQMHQQKAEKQKPDDQKHRQKQTNDLEQKCVKEKLSEIYGRTKLATEEDDMSPCKPIVEEVQVENLTSSTPKLETPQGKDGGKRGLSMLEGQKNQLKANIQRPKKQTFDLEQKFDKVEDEKSYEGRAQKRHQQKKVVVKDVKKLLSSLEITLKNDKGPKMVSDHETQAPGDILGVLGKVTRIGKQRMAQTPEKIQSTWGKEPQPNVKRKEQITTDKVGVLNLSNIFEEYKHSTKKDGRQEKRATVGDKPRDASIGAKRAGKLSSLFK